MNNLSAFDNLSMLAIHNVNIIVIYFSYYLVLCDNAKCMTALLRPTILTTQVKRTNSVSRIK